MKNFLTFRKQGMLITEQTDEPASPDEAGMAMDQAKFIGYVAEEIKEYISGNKEFPEWMQNKLTGLHEKAKDMHAVMAGKYNESKKYTAPTKAEIEADKKKDRAGKSRPSMSTKSVNKSAYKNMMGGLKEEVDEATYKVPNNYAAMKARMNKRKKVTDTEINKVLGPTKNAQQGVEALKKAFKVTDDEAKAMIGRVMPTEANREKGETNESDANWAKSMEKQKFDRLSKKDQDSLTKLRALMAKEKGKKK